MVKVNITYDRDGCAFGMRVTGHAGGGNGKNVICACVSFAAWQTVAILEAARYNGLCAIEKCRLQSGDADIRTVFAGTDAYDGCMTRMEAVRYGLGLLEQKYPEDVCIKIQGYNSP